MWERQRQHTALAIYVRLFALIEAANFDVPNAQITQMRIMSDDLGLTLNGLARHQWRFATPESIQHEAQAAMSAPRQERESTAQQLAGFFGSRGADEAT